MLAGMNAHGHTVPDFCNRMPRPTQLDRRMPFLRHRATGDAAAVNLPGQSGSDITRTTDESEEGPSTSQESDSGDKPSGGLKRFWYSYNEALDERPVFVKSMTSLFGFALGDILAQLIGGSTYNALRTLRLTLFGIFMDGPVGHWWYTTLDKTVMPKRPKSNRAVLVKTALDQLVWAPLFTCVFFTFMCCLEGRPNYIMYSIKKKLLPVLLANYAIWPLAHLVNFKFIPSQQRILYINVCQVLWSSYLSACQAK